MAIDEREKLAYLENTIGGAICVATPD